MTLRCAIVLSMLALLLAACGPKGESAQQVGTNTPMAEPTSTAEPTATTEELPTDTPGASPSEGESPLPQPDESPLAEQGESPLPSPSPWPVEDITEAAAGYLAEQLDVPREDVSMVSIVSETWPDTSLGCPEPGKMYAQVVTEGYIVTFKVGDGWHEVHVDQALDNIVICKPEQKEGPAAAVSYLVEELGVSEDAVRVLAVEKRSWPDASLGCPEPGKSYAEVVTSGYQILLEVEGKEYELHTDETGETVVMCTPTR